MKKICVLSLGLIASMTLSAQTALVKQAEKTFKSADTYAKFEKAIQEITPAFTNPETDRNAQTFWVPGEAAFKLYDNMYGQKILGKDVNLVDMSYALLDGYKYGIMALDVDSVADAKGKIKTKYSNKIVSAIGTHLNDFVNAGSALWDAQKYEKAYEAFTDYLSIPENPRLGKAAPKALADSTIAQIEYYRGLSAWQANMLPQAAEAFDRMIAIGYDDINAYDYAFSVAYQLQDEPRKLSYSQAALDKYGTQKPEFLQRIVNSYIDAKNYTGAKDMLEKAIAADPNNAAYYLSLGVLYENEEKPSDSKDAYKKAVELDSNNAYANYYYGRALLQEYDRLDQKTADMSQVEYNKYSAETLRPILKEAVTYLEKAYQLDNDLTDPLRYLKNVYYILQDGENLKRVENLLL